MRSQLLHPVFPKYRVWAESYLKPCPVWTSWTALATLHGVEQLGGGRKVKLGGLFAEEEGGLFALGIIIFHLQ